MESEAGRSADRSWSKAPPASASEVRQSLPPISSLTDDYGRRSPSRDPRSEYAEQGPSYRYQQERPGGFPTLLGSRQNSGPSSGWSRSDDRQTASDRSYPGQYEDSRRPSDGSDASGPRLPSLLGTDSPNRSKQRASPREPYSRNSGRVSPVPDRRWAREASPRGDHPGFLRPRSSNSYSRRHHSDSLGSTSEEQQPGGPWPRSAEGSPNARVHGVPAHVDEPPFRTRSGPELSERERMMMMDEEERRNREREQQGAWRDWPSSAPPTHPYRADPRGMGAGMDERGIRRRLTVAGVPEEPMHGYGPPPLGAGPPALPPYASPRHAPYGSSLPPPHAYGRGGPPPPGPPMGRPAPSSLMTGPAATPVVTAPTTASSNRRVAHLLSEQRRRESINTGFEDLRQALPACRDGQDSKATVLRRAVEYIHELESIIEQTHRVKSEKEPMNFDSRSPPNDHEPYGRHWPGPSDDRGGAGGGPRRGPSGSGGSDAGPRIVGVPAHISRDSVDYASAMRKPVSPLTNEWDKELKAKPLKRSNSDPEDKKRRRLSEDGESDESERYAVDAGFGHGAAGQPRDYLPARGEERETEADRRKGNTIYVERPTGAQR